MEIDRREREGGPGAQGGPGALSDALRNPERSLIGTVVSSADPVFAEMAAKQFDLIWIDLEHSALSIRDVQMLVIAVNSGGAFSLIRLPGADPGFIGRLLDTGTDGIVVPRVETRASAEALAAELRYPPAGRRGFAPRRAALYAGHNSATRSPACIFQIESPNGVDRAADLAEIDACDALVVGTSDLSFALGAPRQLAHPAIAKATRAVRDAALAAGKGWGVAAAGDPAEVRRLLKPYGAAFVYGSDFGMLAEAIQRRTRELRGQE